MSKLDNFHMMTAWILSQESSCASNRVGAIVVKDNRIISTGYNGTKKGVKNCKDHSKDMGWLLEDGKLNPYFRLSHRRWTLMNEYHAEQNAFDNITRLGISSVGSTVFTTLSPCIECCKRISNLGVERVVYSEEYDNADMDWKEFLEHNGVVVNRITKEELNKNYNFIDVNQIEYFLVGEKNDK